MALAVVRNVHIAGTGRYNNVMVDYLVSVVGSANVLDFTTHNTTNHLDTDAWRTWEAPMSFTKIAPKEVKLRCHRCGRTRNVRIVMLGSMSNCIELCGQCRKALDIR